MFNWIGFNDFFQEIDEAQSANDRIIRQIKDLLVSFDAVDGPNTDEKVN